MTLLKINQTIGVLMIVFGFAYMLYMGQTVGLENTSTWSLGVFYLGLIWYGVSRFLIWMKKD